MKEGWIHEMNTAETSLGPWWSSFTGRTSDDIRQRRQSHAGSHMATLIKQQGSRCLLSELEPDAKTLRQAGSVAGFAGQRCLRAGQFTSVLGRPGGLEAAALGRPATEASM